MPVSPEDSGEGENAEPSDGDNSEAVEPEGGCSSSIVSLAVVSTSILGLGIGFVRKKKKNEE